MPIKQFTRFADRAYNKLVIAAFQLNFYNCINKKEGCLFYETASLKTPVIIVSHGNHIVSSTHCKPAIWEQV